MKARVSSRVMPRCIGYHQNDASAWSAARASRSSSARGRRIRRAVSSVSGGGNGVGHAELVVLGDHQLLLGDAAGGALGVAGHLEGPETLLQGVVGQQTAREGLADAQQELDGL